MISKFSELEVTRMTPQYHIVSKKWVLYDLLDKEICRDSKTHRTKKSHTKGSIIVYTSVKFILQKRNPTSFNMIAVMIGIYCNENTIFILNEYILLKCT